jgi:hypothetical protein
MKPITVVNSTQYRAIHLSPEDEEAAEIVLGWVQAELGAPSAVDLSNPRTLRQWAIRHPAGNIALVHAADFARDFDTIDDEPALSVNELEKLFSLGEPLESSKVEETPEEAFNRAQAYFNEKVVEFSVWLENGGDGTAGEDNELTFEDGIEEAKEKFYEIFKVEAS